MAASNEGPVSWRARFRQPREHLNPLKLRVACPVTVEVFQAGKTGTRWKARTLDDGDRAARPITYDDKTELVGVSATHCQAIVGEYFEERLTEWSSHTR